MDYSVMFDRNIGVFSEAQQKLIRNFNFAVLGCGGMGGISAQILARTGVENILVADPDIFESVNINNQFNAEVGTIGKNKAEVVGSLLKEINPGIRTEIHPEGVTENNMRSIIANADIILDCIDYNELYFSYLINKESRLEKKYVLAPQAIGYGGSVLVFDPNGMSFNEHLGLREGLTKDDFKTIIATPEKYAPIMPDYIDKDIIEKTILKQIPIPNIGLAQTLTASIMVAEALFILLGIRKPTAVPKIIAIDLLKNKFVI